MAKIRPAWKTHGAIAVPDVLHQKQGDHGGALQTLQLQIQMQVPSD